VKHTIRFTSEKIAQRLALITPLIHRQTHPIPPFRLIELTSPSDAPPILPLDLSAPVIPIGSIWGKPDLNFVLQTTFQVPESFTGDDPLGLYLPIGDADNFSHPETLVYLDDEPYAGIDRHHQLIMIPEKYRDGQLHTLSLHGWTGLTTGKKLIMAACGVVQLDRATQDFVGLARVALQAADLLEETHPAKARLYNALDDAFKLLDIREPIGLLFYASVPDALTVLQERIGSAGQPLDAELFAAGHAHIDVTWLWTLEQTRRKAGRTFHTVLRLMEEFPDFHFTQSQPQLYDFIRQDYPALFESIKERVADGRWEVIGGMWVEADCNISSGEALARQFLLGRRFFRDHFGEGVESPVLWLPDVFGYAWCLPQLIKLAGLDYFFTIKIGFNQYNKLPYDSFWWQGLDGTKVLTHFSTSPDRSWGDREPDLRNAATYNADLSAFTALGTWVKSQHKDAQRSFLISYGYGDGGGGPTREMNQNAQVLRYFPALPQVRQGKVIDFFRQLQLESGHQLPTWNGELYFELHRGTYTTQSRNKRANRKSEVLLHDTELLSALATALDPTYAYPHAVLYEAWKLLCLNQFHDIIPGSSIHDVYTESLAQYEQLRQVVEALHPAAESVITEHVGGDLVVINPTGFGNPGPAFYPGTLPEGTHLYGGGYTQAVEAGTLLATGVVISYGVYSLSFTDQPHGVPKPTDYPLSVGLDHLENQFVRAEFNDQGDLIRLYDKKAQRDVMPPNTVGNQFQAFEDRPLQWDAWDIDIFYDDKQYLADPATTIRIVETGPLRVMIEIERRILNSTYRQQISLVYNSAILRFDTVIDWRERHTLLKIAFPVDVLSPVATYEIQWGTIQRPTHRNTSWDWARFEGCAQKWVDLSEGGYGVALLNDCKYGHDIRDNVIRLTALRSPTYPDPEADQGQHTFSYALYPHPNDGSGLLNSDIAAKAYAFNDPLRVIEGTHQKSRWLNPLFWIEDGAILETIKVAEDGDGYIVRLYEGNRVRGVVTLNSAFPIQAAWITNLLEENQDSLPIENNRIRLSVHPYQIITVRLRLAHSSESLP
jgi:alpha-mannosidase